ncbi:hypothetical protein ACO2KH_01910 [Leptospira terpstrae]|uniref:hypothetical protein n=1 Tax=Leptospira terpstrae TaxID=293075 RepID=UPI003CFD56AA
MNRYFLIILILLTSYSCTGLTRLLDNGDNNTDQYVAFALYQYLLSSPGSCPTVNLTLDKGTNYPLTLSSTSSVIFNISSTNNLPPPNQNREYVLVITKDASTNLEFSALRLCNISNSSLTIESPISSTPTELQYRLFMNDVRTLRNAFYLKLISGNASVSIRQD